ncbi:hypothetical protein [Roseospira visakhapatnamensis]|uniref:Uncharacterized protein n=1 Tax=Roseospira visakhapatnamensis TaxID=390880 RepID=A0A7W6RB43_9PROT|nr:hypothetical protein [Roseospira visakhapatnamensis]MBB4264598.1 hypothetical protein [Roseospira visakhapatnamensis]
MPLLSTPFLVTGYVGLCAILGIIGRRRKMGGWGYFFASLVLTPVIGALLVAVSDPRRDWTRDKVRSCDCGRDL